MTSRIWNKRCQWSIAMAFVAAVVIYNSVGTWLLRPLSRPRNLSDSTRFASTCSKISSSTLDREPLARLDLRLGRWDFERKFKTFDHAAVGELYSEASATRKVCLATQSSIESLKEILKIAAHWSGPISLAAFAIGDEMWSVQAFATWLFTCQPDTYSRLALHIATSSENPAVLGTMPGWARNCSAEPLPPTERILKSAEWRAKHPYPQNLLRNLARKNCHTPYVYMVDVDIVPSKGMAEALDHFLSTTENCERCAYVIPTYELDNSVRGFPANKSELLRLARKKFAVPFHQKVFKLNQLSSNLSKWEASNGIESNETHVSHNVTNYKFRYEPFYVAPDTVPPHEERFLGYGFTRSSQVYEMFLLGYQFKVLSPIFTIHWGLQTTKRPRWRDRQIEENLKMFKTFRKELHAKYYG